MCSNSQPIGLSVLVTTYNHEGYISTCLDSILEQNTNFPIEIIVIDDASVDETPKIILDYKRRFPGIIKVELLESNHRSRSLPVYSKIYEKASGQFIATLDGDDYWSDPQKLQKQVDFLTRNLGYSFSFHNARGITDESNLMTDVSLPSRLKRDFSADELMIFTDWIYLGTIVFRKSFSSLPPEFDIIPNRDNFLPILLGEFGAAKYHDDVGDLMYRQHRNGYWTGKNKKERALIHSRTGLIICAYFIRIGIPELAKNYITKKLNEELNLGFNS